MGRRLVVGVNDVASQRPDLAEQWHPHRNKGPIGALIQTVLDEVSTLVVS